MNTWLQTAPVGKAILKSNAIESHLQAKAQELGAIEHIDQTGEMLPAYINFSGQTYPTKAESAIVVGGH